MLKIGITEQGDAGLDFSWRDRLNLVDGAILITKNLNDAFIQHVLTEHANNRPLIVHAGCTGWSGSIVEPYTLSYGQQLQQLKALVDAGFPIKQCVLRIDPIFPTKSGLARVRDVLNLAFDLRLLPLMRVRISVLNEYKHVKERFQKLGYVPIYGKSFTAPKTMMDAVRNSLSLYDIQFHTCAEPNLTDTTGLFVHSGCVSNIDLNILGLPKQNVPTNPQNRHGCNCLSCKTELLGNKSQCPHRCAYCYWQKDYQP